MKKLKKDVVFVVTEFVNDTEGAVSYFTQITKLNTFIHKLVCSGFNEDKDADDSCQIWSGNLSDDRFDYVIKQHTYINSSSGFMVS